MVVFFFFCSFFFFTWTMSRNHLAKEGRSSLLSLCVVPRIELIFISIPSSASFLFNFTIILFCFIYLLGKGWSHHFCLFNLKNSHFHNAQGSKSQVRYFWFGNLGLHGFDLGRIGESFTCTCTCEREMEKNKRKKTLF